MPSSHLSRGVIRRTSLDCLHSWEDRGAHTVTQHRLDSGTG